MKTSTKKKLLSRLFDAVVLAMWVPIFLLGGYCIVAVTIKGAWFLMVCGVMIYGGGKIFSTLISTLISAC
jgi:hypothetical protein